MTGLLDANHTLSAVLWADSELCGVEVSYSDVCLRVRETTGSLKRVTCAGYLGYELVGFWDEVVIAGAEVTGDGDFLRRCLDNLERRLGPSLPLSGSGARNLECAFQFVLTLDDGCQLAVVTKELRVEAEGSRSLEHRFKP